MSELKQLNQDWKSWIAENIVNGVSTETISSKLLENGWVGAAYELMTQHNKSMTVPFIDTKSNTIHLEDIEVSVVSECHKPFIVVVDNFLRPKECEELIAVSEKQLKASQIVHPEGDGNIFDPSRTSVSKGFVRGYTPIHEMIENRIAELINWPVEKGEGLHILRYEDGGEYKPHYDYFDPDKKGRDKILQNGGQRVGTFIMYLSDVEEGGATKFPKINFEVRPNTGRAVYFANTLINGALNPLSLHAGVPVTKGVKYLATKWLRQNPHQC